ncbi:N-acetylneuraminate synthase [Pseudomaricurvus alcaniphilus]|uniref:N-acetylneuraminate synthase n=1 Tax=Pseudomaricurvus alcaniphilus TaxID=1166482 RepID=UPI00140978C1|nr:N-acetylneuraminate synthase [Pseudomaricurvus alcaniphilus]NHN39441.1 N-acetylneuraminate synthase [Pseudomaricurvus alcaniphilus]
MSVCIIAEAGVNHNGSLQRALELIDAAADAGADVVKFQTFNAASLVNQQAPMADYQKQNIGVEQSQFEMLKALELPLDAYAQLQRHCQARGIEFMSSPFDIGSLKLLVQELHCQRIKLASGEITNGPLLLAAARCGAELILSTGMATTDEISDALAVLAWGIGEPERDPDSLQQCHAALGDPALLETLRQRLILLHCTSQYPAPVTEVNLKAMQTMAQSWGIPVGYSDHTEGIVVPIAAAALGACVIEKHFTLDRSLPGPDHKASLEPDELAQMVAAIRATSAALGSGVKAPSPVEANTRNIARKSLQAATAIQPGERFDQANLIVRRPGTGISPMHYWDYLQRSANRTYQVGDLLDE